jgi:hypothetical protein
VGRLTARVAVSRIVTTKVGASGDGGVGVALLERVVVAYPSVPGVEIRLGPVTNKVAFRVGVVVVRERGARRCCQVVVAPAAGFPPEFVNVAVHPNIVHVLSGLVGEDVPDRAAAGGGRRGARCRRDVVVMPGTVLPPELVHAKIARDVVEVLRAFGIEDERAWSLDKGERRAGDRIGQVVVMPAAAVPPELVHVAVVGDVEHVLRTLGGKDAAGGSIAARVI